MMKQIEPKNLQENVFTMIGKQWLLVCGEKDGKVNAMTASWGGIGVLWNKNVVTVYIRPQRYTKEFIDHADTFSIMVLPEDRRKEMNYMGTVSGRDEDKMQHCNFHVDHILNTPYVTEAAYTIICKKLYVQPMEDTCFIDKEVAHKNYLNKDYHVMYVGEILGIYQKAGN